MPYLKKKKHSHKKKNVGISFKNIWMFEIFFYIFALLKQIKEEKLTR